MRIVLDIDETLNNLNTTVNNKYNIVDRLNVLNRYNLRDTNLSVEQIELFKQGYLDDSCYTNSKSLANEYLLELLIKLNTKGSTIFYTKCIKDTHRQVKLDWLKNIYNITDIDMYSIEEFNNKPYTQTSKGIYYLTALKDKVNCYDVDIVVDDCMDNLLKYSDNTKKVLISKSWNEFEYNELKDKVNNLVRVQDIDECLEYMIKLLIANNNTYELKLSVEGGTTLTVDNLKLIANDTNRVLKEVTDYTIVILDGDTAICLGNLYLEVVEDKLKVKTNLDYIIQGGILTHYSDINTTIVKSLNIIVEELGSMFVYTTEGLKSLNNVEIV